MSLRPRHLPLAALLAASSSCVTLDESAWTLHFSREAYTSGGAPWLDAVSNGLEGVDHFSPEEALIGGGIVLTMMALPLLADLVCLPVCLPRDLFFDASL